MLVLWVTAAVVGTSVGVVYRIAILGQLICLVVTIVSIGERFSVVEGGGLARVNFVRVCTVSQMIRFEMITVCQFLRLGRILDFEFDRACVICAVSALVAEDVVVVLVEQVVFVAVVGAILITIFLPLIVTLFFRQGGTSCCSGTRLFLYQVLVIFRGVICFLMFFVCIFDGSCRSLPIIFIFPFSQQTIFCFILRVFFIFRID